MTTNNSDEIRVGMVGVNTWHAEAFSDVFLGSGPARHLAPIRNAKLTALWGTPEDARGDLASKVGAREFFGNVEELIGQIDLALVIDDSGGGARHRELAEPFLRAGVPVMVDKPMTIKLSDAQALFALASETGTPLMSASALRFSEEIQDNARAIEEIGEIQSIDVLGPGDWYYYGIHAVELLLTLMPSSVEWVQRHATDQRDVTLIGFADGKVATVSVLRDAYYTFTASIYGKSGWLAMEVKKNYEFYHALLQSAVEMARTGVVPVRPEQTIEVLRVLHAGIRSADLDRRVKLFEVE